MERLVGWKPVDHSWIKMNINGSIEKDNATCGGLIRDKNGSWIVGFAQCLGASSILLYSLLVFGLGWELVGLGSTKKGYH